MEQDIIQLLPDAIANQIAAGEVVQRPASVVKELMENALDAEAKSVEVWIEEAGKQLIQVIDDGKGMSEIDARMCFERHATSKIRQTEDLFRIYTMGFRGEALASIAAVAQVNLKTRRASEELGTAVQIDASQLVNHERVQSALGTTVSVKNLFFNVPARRKFLKSNAVEMRHIIEQFQRIALAYPECDFKLYHNQQEIFNLVSGKLGQRIVGIFGKNYRKQLVPCQEDTPLLRLEGYVGSPEKARKTRGEQFFFVNKRYIKHPYLHHAVSNAFEGLIAEDQHPFYAINLEIDPQHIDVNIHPTKTEVKFEDERSMYAIIQSAVRKCLSVHNFRPSLDFEVDVNYDPMPNAQKAIDENALYPGQSDGDKTPFSGGFKPEKDSRQQHNLQNWEQLYEGLKQSTPEFEPTSSGRIESRANQPLSMQSQEKRKALQLHQQYILSPVKSGLMLIDQRAAQERILYDRYIKALDRQQQASAQRLLFPVEIELPPADFALILDMSDEIHNLGFVFDIKEDQRKLVLQAIPANVGQEQERELFEGFLEQFKHYQSNLSLEQPQILARSLAKRASSRLRVGLSSEEMQHLIDQLFASSNPNYSPDGKPIVVMLSLDTIKEFFNK